MAPPTVRGRGDLSITHEPAGARRQWSTDHGPQPSARELSQYRHHGAYRCRSDDHQLAYPLLYRHILQDRGSPRWRSHDGVDGTGADARLQDTEDRKRVVTWKRVSSRVD